MRQLSDRVIKAYFSREHPSFRLKYLEKSKSSIDGYVTIVSIYSDSKTKEYCLLTSLKKDGDYLFLDSDAFNSGYYSQSELISKDYINDCFSKVEVYLNLRKRVMQALSNGILFPSILSIGMQKNLTFYYLRDGVLDIAVVRDNHLLIDLPVEEQKNLTEYLKAVGITVVNNLMLEGEGTNVKRSRF